MSDYSMTDLAEAFRRQVLANLEAENRRWDALSGVDPDNRPTRFVEQPRDPAWIKRRDDFAARWNAIIEEGLDHDYLDALRGDEAPEYVLNKDSTEWVEEPNPDYDPKKPNPNAIPEGTTSITFPRSS